MRTLDLKGANAVQTLGGVETYLRRYLYMAMLDIVESDHFDNGRQPQPKRAAPVNPFVEQVVGIVSALPKEKRKEAGEVIKAHNNGSSNFREVTDEKAQAEILRALKEAYNV